jgi:hypothetical protein
LVSTGGAAKPPPSGPPRATYCLTSSAMFGCSGPALALELHQEVKLTTGEKVKKLRLVARTLVNNAIDGDTTAARECFDRMDGKVAQSVDATQVRGDITVTWVRPAY